LLIVIFEKCRLEFADFNNTAFISKTGKNEIENMDYLRQKRI
jgi:hypothetical protein